ncbi:MULTISPECIES: dihydrolipoamide acetyltransferase family protein [unclassified Aeromicrobium]|uniref:dihydrolipoamide acetyltransferase family protein n=1 Tax=unclassified Aeromicrobium TaxID=2633570 RepID=UPI0006F9A667|nr:MULTISPECIES: dihydrolipoamide acetyltransferase family protein [unclassified Aeromicrobium]KQO36532.1 branched-chain alpha-keto acid dehydrogenase subunit E2 [Aeromicrobium sp. Leaf245]KQP83968.1 branched-chain alpha-keto acid dehydrogenase subunit E2 [Aeromicrobium sp. Leaf291]
MSEFRLPDVGEGLTEAEVLTWHVAVGDVVEVNQVIVDIETAKSVVELPSPFAGEVTALLVREGTTVPVGTPIIAIGGPTGAVVPDDARDLTDERPVEDDAEEPAARDKREPVLVGYGVRTASTRRRRRKGDEQVSAPLAAPNAGVARVERPARSGSATGDVRALAKPPVRKLAKDHGVDLTTVPCDGPVVTRADVEAFIAGRRSEPVTVPTSTSPAAPAPVRSAEGDTRIPVKGVRKATAQAMVSSAFTAPHVTEWVTLDVTATMELVERLKADRRFREVKVSPTLVVAKAVCLALARTPELNASWDEQAQEIVLKGSVNLGVAAATDRGLVVPNIPGADRMSLVELAQALGDLTATARAGRTQPAQMSGGTFTITNVGVFGVDAGTPILNPGETGILCVGQIDRRPWIVGAGPQERVEARWVTTLAVSFDHRVVDGQQGSQFLADVAALLRDPALALTF